MVALSRRRILSLFALALAAQAISPSLLGAEARWRAATDDELKSLLPARAPVQQERIETEMRTASGITDGRGHFVAGVVLITAGYSADGKYSHFFLTQVALRVGNFALDPGSYVVGWQHIEDGLEVKFYEAATGRPVGTVAAGLNPAITRVESFRIWLPADRSVMQIGRFSFPYRIGDVP
ncbi:hypothetical protein [Silvibacterium dinghuense]|uniref:Uncharacterized protein n=1 Tax=Silvibacterium dinghuense TaxID=1560006 RepID=A0A4Q1SIW1_9BACT|nr:hypothetical protein [Silvibacterium dinghuense]RXS97561.1 hypothetical protein ESZ00_06645 [Silvibacterium dinghuense]